MYRDKKYYAALDLYRFLAAITVALFFHYSIVLGGSPFSGSVVGDFLIENGGYVVELFFIISGFVACNAYLDKVQQGDLPFGRFLIGRIIRMYPTMIISVIFIMVLMWLGYALWQEPLVKDSEVTLFAFILNMLGLNGGIVAESAFVSVNGPSWYVSVLMVCYILFFAIGRLCKKSRSAMNVLYMVIIVIGLFVYLNSVNLPFISLSCARGYIYFFLGVLWAQVQSKLSFKGNVITCIAGVIIILMFIFAKYNNLLYKESLEIGLCVVFPLLLIGLNFTGLNTICDNKAIKFLGSISFGIFMWNIPTLICVRLIGHIAGTRLNPANIRLFTVIAAANIITGILSYILIEQKLTQRLQPKLKQNA